MAERTTRTSSTTTPASHAGAAHDDHDVGVLSSALHNKGKHGEAAAEPAYTQREIDQILFYLENVSIFGQEPGPGPNAAVTTAAVEMAEGMYNFDDLTAVQRLEIFERGFQRLLPFISFMLADESRRSDVQNHLFYWTTPQHEQLKRAAEKEKNDAAVAEAEQLAASLGGTAKPGEEYDTEGKPGLEKEIAQFSLVEAMEAAHDLGELYEYMTSNPATKSFIPDEAAEKVEHANRLLPVLGAAIGFMKLSDKDFQAEMAKKNKEGHFASVTTTAELMVVVQTLVKDTLLSVGNASSMLMRLVGDEKMAEKIDEVMGEEIGKGFTRVAGVALVVHGAIELFTGHDLGDQIKGGGEIIGGGLMIATGESGPAAGLMLWVNELVDITNMFGELASQSATGPMANSWPMLGERLQTVTGRMNALAAAGMLARNEQNPDRKQRFENAIKTEAARAGEAIDYVLDDLTTPEPAKFGFEGQDDQGKPVPAKNSLGSFAVVRAEFTPYLSLKGKRSPDEVTKAGNILASKIMWVLKHTSELFEEEGDLEPSVGASARRGQEQAKMEEEFPPG